jgi:hypothetical protein
MKFIIYILFLLPISISAQIQIDPAGDFWDRDVKEALSKIKSIDESYYKLIEESCYKISFWNGTYSTNAGQIGSKGEILISASDMKIGDINNICSVIIHESMHLRIKMLDIRMHMNAEEIICYKYELEFLYKIPNAGDYLIRHAKEQIGNRLINK